MTARGNTRWSGRSTVEGRKGKPRGTDNESENQWGFAFCFLFTNQAGTVVYSFSGIALILTTMLSHWYTPSLTSTGVRALQNLLLHTYFIVMLVGFIMAFVAAYNEKGTLAKGAGLLVLVGTILYFIFFVFSFFTDSMLMLYVCPEMRCPDHHWLQDAMWRGYVLYSENIERYRNLEKEISKMEEKINSLIKEKLTSNDLNVSISYPFLQDRFLKTYPHKEKPTNDSLELEAENQTDRSIDIYHITIPQERKGQYIRVLDPVNEYSTPLIVVSVLFGLMIIAYFAYAIITFFAYGMYLSSEE